VRGLEIRSLFILLNKPHKLVQARAGPSTRR